MLNEYADGITRNVNYHHDLGQPYRDGNKLFIKEHYYIMVFPGKTDLTAVELVTDLTLDGLVFTFFQTQKNVLLELEYLEHWQELVDGILSELVELFPEPEITQPFPAHQPSQIDMPRPKEVTVRQIDDVVQACLHTITGWSFKRSIQGATILYTIWSNAETKKLPLGVFRVWEWLDGGGRCGWLTLDNATSEQERLRHLFYMQMIVPILVQANADLSSLASTDQTMQNEKPKKKSGAHHKQDDVWAWKQIHESGRDEDIVRAEWMEKIKNDRKRNLHYTSLNRHWRRIKAKSWLE